MSTSMRITLPRRVDLKLSAFYLLIDYLQIRQSYVNYVPYYANQNPIKSQTEDSNLPNPQFRFKEEKTNKSAPTKDERQMKNDPRSDVRN